MALCVPSKAQAAQMGVPKAPLVELFAPPETSPQEPEAVTRARAAGLLATYGIRDLPAPIPQQEETPAREDTPQQAQQRQEIRAALRRAQGNGILRAAEETSVVTGTSLWEGLLRAYFESRCGEEMSNRYSTARGPRQLTNETGVDYVRLVGDKALEDLKDLDPSIVPQFSLLHDHIKKLEKDSRKLHAFTESLKGARTAAQAKGVPPAIFKALDDVRMNATSAFLLQKHFEKRQIADLRGWMGDFSSPYLTDELLGRHLGQFGPDGTKRLIATLRDAPKTPMGVPFAKIWKINPILPEMPVEDYVKLQHEKYGETEELVKEEYRRLYQPAARQDVTPASAVRTKTMGFTKKSLIHFRR